MGDWFTGRFFSLTMLGYSGKVSAAPGKESEGALVRKRSVGVELNSTGLIGPRE